MRRRGPWLLLTAGCTVVFVALYCVARGTHVGRRFDTDAIVRASGRASLPQLASLSSGLIWTIDVGAVVLVVAATALFFALRGQRAEVVAAAAAIGGAIGTSEVLKHVLG